MAKLPAMVYKYGIQVGYTGSYTQNDDSQRTIRRKDKEAAERELLRRCLKKHIFTLEEERLWGSLVPGRASREDLEIL